MQLKWACCCALLRFLQDAATLQRIPCSRLCAPARTPPGGRTLNKSIDFKEARLLLASTRVFSIFTPLHHHPPLPQPPLPPSAIFLWGRRSGATARHGHLWGLPGFNGLAAEAAARWMARALSLFVGHQACNNRERGPRGGGMLMLAHCGADSAFMGRRKSRKMWKISCPQSLRAPRASAEDKAVRSQESQR